MGMMQLIVLAVVQGLTEFLPISSSGHLVLVPSIFGWTDQGLAFDVAVHFGSLIAVCVFFRHDIAALLRGTHDILTGDHQSVVQRIFATPGLLSGPSRATAFSWQWSTGWPVPVAM
jgi:undecaprenyl-diphosphatase